jgi:hypothetical protein
VVKLDTCDWQLVIWYFDGPHEGKMSRKFFGRYIKFALDGESWAHAPDGFQDDFYLDLWDFIPKLRCDNIK